MVLDPNAPDAGTGDEAGKSKWEEAGFDSEDAMLEAAKAATALKAKIDEAEATLKKERAAKSKTDTDYMRQSNEIGALKKKLKELEKPPEPPAADDEADVDDVLESVSDDEEKALLAVLNDPSNSALKKAVANGGDKAKAEFVKNYRLNAPVQETALTLKKRKPDTVQLSSIAKAVRDMFSKHDQDERNSLAVVGSGGSPQNRTEAGKQSGLYGGKGASYFIKKK
jgi:predicted nuclease with TOPRIM domain